MRIHEIRAQKDVQYTLWIYENNNNNEEYSTIHFPFHPKSLWQHQISRNTSTERSYFLFYFPCPRSRSDRFIYREFLFNIVPILFIFISLARDIIFNGFSVFSVLSRDMPSLSKERKFVWLYFVILFGLSSQEIISVKFRLYFLCLGQSRKIC